jgi:hypothetical protein
LAAWIELDLNISFTDEARLSGGINKVQIDGFYCTAGNFGIWKDPKDCRQFYICKESKTDSENVRGNIRSGINKINYQSLKLEAINESGISIERHRCITDYVYSEKKNKCELLSEAAMCTSIVKKQGWNCLNCLLATDVL